MTVRFDAFAYYKTAHLLGSAAFMTYLLRGGPAAYEFDFSAQPSPLVGRRKFAWTVKVSIARYLLACGRRRIVEIWSLPVEVLQAAGVLVARPSRQDLESLACHCAEFGVRFAERQAGPGEPALRSLRRVCIRSALNRRLGRSGRRVEDVASYLGISRAAAYRERLRMVSRED